MHLLLKRSWTTKEGSNQFIGINSPGFSLEGMVLKTPCPQPSWKVDSLEKTLVWKDELGQEDITSGWINDGSICSFILVIDIDGQEAQ